MSPQSPLPMSARPLPADDLICSVLAALRHRAARDRMRALAIGPEAFDWTPERTIAGALMAERPFTAAEQALLDRDDGRFVPWGVAINRTLTDEWAVEIVDRFAADRARWWFPRWLVWLGRGVRAGQPLSWAISEMDWLRTQLAPVMHGEGKQ